MLKAPWALCCVLALTACGGSTTAKSADSSEVASDGHAIAGSRLSLWLPPGMHRPTRSLAFKLDEPLVVVALTELTAPDAAKTDEMMQGMKSGAELPSSEPVTRGSASGFLGSAPGENPGMTKQVLGLASGTAAAIVVVQHTAEGESIAKHVLESVRLDAQGKLDPLLLSGISIGDQADFEVWNAMSHPILITEKGARPPLPATTPSLGLAVIPYPKPDMSDRELGQMLGGALSDFKPDFDKAKGAEMNVDRRPAFAMAVPGEHQGQPIMAYGFVVRGKESALLGFGHVGIGSADKDVPRFERVAKSIKLDDGILGPLER